MRSLSRSFLFTFWTTLALLPTIQCGSGANKGGGSNPPPAKTADPGWPREITRNGVRLVYYQPQVDEWKNLRILRARFALVLTPPNGKPVVGVEEVRGDTQTDVERRTVLINNIEIVNVRFPSLSGADEAKMQELLKTTFPGKPLTVSLDRLIAGVEAGQEDTKTVAVKTNPPPIFVSTEPAILLTVAGVPVLAPIKGLRLQFVVNSNWDLFLEPSESRYYLLAGETWLTTESLSASWTVPDKLPAELNKLPTGENWDHVRKAAGAGAKQSSKAPKVFYSDQPAELIVFAGDPVYQKIPETQLQYATNTDSWVFSDSGDGQIYYLVAGRWFRSPQLQGPWVYAGNDLPEDFQKIPQDNNDLAEVLASIPGTPEAKDAVLLAQVPTTAVVNRAAAQSQAKVNYNGAPQFAPIEGTTLSYATNADADVIRVEEMYYLCLNAIWFSSPSPTGPWTVVSAVPEVIYTIPPSSPVYHVTYVKVDGSTPEEVTCSYTAGYSGAYIAGAAAGAALVWGTGYYYPPYIYPGTVPVYRPYYATYGVAAAYYPYSGAYAVGGYAYGPYASAGRAAWYNPQTGGYGRAYTTQTPYGGRTSAWGYNPSTDTAWTTKQGHGYYSQWGTSTVTRGGETYQAGHVSTNYGNTAVAKGPNNVYAGHDGNVYKKDDNGDWSKWDNGGWQPVNNQGTLSSQNKSNQETLSSQNKNNQGTLSSQNKENGRQTSTEGTKGATSQTSGNGQTSAQDRKGQGKQGQNKEAQAPTTANKSEQTNRRQSSESAGTKRTSTAGSKGEASNDLTSGLDREASSRQRGSQNANLQQRSQQRGSQYSRSSSGQRQSRGSREGGRRRE
jgi:hypothetical protein